MPTSEPTPQPTGTPPDVGGAAETPRKPSERTGSRGQADWYKQVSVSSIGIEIALVVSFGVFGGQWLQDNVTHWSPWTSYIGIFFGLLGAGVTVSRFAIQWRKELDTMDFSEFEESKPAQNSSDREQSADQGKTGSKSA